MLRLRNPLFVALFAASLILAGHATARADIISATITAGISGPMDVAVGPFHDRLYVSNNTNSTVTVYSIPGYSLIGTVSVPAGSITNLAVSPDNSKVYVVSQNSGTVQIISTATLTITGQISVGGTPIDVAFNASGSTAYVTNYSPPSVHIVNTSTNTFSTVSLHEGPRGVVVVNVPGFGTRVYIAHAGAFNNEVSYSTPTFSSTNYIAVSGGPFFVAATPDGTKVFASLNTVSQTACINTSSNAVTNIADAGGGPFGIAVAGSPNGSRVYTADSNGNGFGYDVSLIDVASQSLVGQLFVGKKPRGVTASPDGTRVYVAANTGNKVNVIDTTQ